MLSEVDKEMEREVWRDRYLNSNTYDNRRPLKKDSEVEDSDEQL